MKKYYSILYLVFLLIPNLLFAQELLQDFNGDGIVTVAAFGDSIAFGQGDTHDIGEFVVVPELTNGDLGLLQRLRQFAGVSTVNLAVPGEFFTGGGIARFGSAIAGSNADVIVFLEGANDAGDAIDGNIFQANLQKAVNIAEVLGRQMVLSTVLPPCCNRMTRVPITRGYSREIRSVARWNDLPVADIEMAWDTTCNSLSNCQLYNIPDGLHPNNAGYDVIGETLLATLFDIDIFASDGPSSLGNALGLGEGAVTTQPAPMTAIDEEG